MKIRCGCELCRNKKREVYLVVDWDASEAGIMKSDVTEFNTKAQAENQVAVMLCHDNIPDGNIVVYKAEELRWKKKPGIEITITE